MIELAARVLRRVILTRRQVDLVSVFLQYREALIRIGGTFIVFGARLLGLVPAEVGATWVTLLGVRSHVNFM